MGEDWEPVRDVLTYFWSVAPDLGRAGRVVMQDV